MAKFQCQVSGNFIEVIGESDIKDMLTHPQYKLVEEKVKEVAKTTIKSKD
jgi:hypothetical protein